MSETQRRLRVIFTTLAHLDALIVAGEPADRLRGKLNVALLEVRELLGQPAPPDIGSDVPGGGAV